MPVVVKYQVSVPGPQFYPYAPNHIGIDKTIQKNFLNIISIMPTSTTVYEFIKHLKILQTSTFSIIFSKYHLWEPAVKVGFVLKQTSVKKARRGSRYSLSLSFEKFLRNFEILIYSYIFKYLQGVYAKSTLFCSIDLTCLYY